MNYAFIDNTKKPAFFKLKPKIFSFDAGHNLYIFPGRCSIKRLNKALLNYSYTLFPSDCNNDLKQKIWCKIIIQCLKEYDINEIVFCCAKHMNYLNLLKYLFDKNIEFALFSSGDSTDAADYFLEKYGLPVRTKEYIITGLIVYVDGNIPDHDSTVKILDLSSSLNHEKITVSEYFIKETPFPIKINSLPLLESALTLTGKEIKDITIKLCIIGTKCE